MSPNSGIDGGRDGSDDHRDELRDGSDGDVWECGGDERGGGERDADHGDNAGGYGGSGDRDSNGQRPERKPELTGSRTCSADGEQRGTEWGIDGGRYGSDDHRDELCDGSHGDVWECGGDQRGGGERDADHGDNAGGTAGAVTVTVTVSGQSGSLSNGFTYSAPPTVSSVSAE